MRTARGSCCALRGDTKLSIRGSKQARQRRRDLRAITADGVAFSAMVGIGEAYVPAFALAVGASDGMAGLLASVPLLAGAVLQLATPRAVRALGSHRTWVVTCALGQALSFVPLVIGAIHGALSPRWIFTCMALYWGLGMATGPAWNTWVELLIPRVLRARYLAARTRWAQLALLVALVAGGAILEADGGAPHTLPFAFLFALACTMRLTSAGLLASQSQPPYRFELDTKVSLTQFVARLGRGTEGGLLALALCMQAAAHVSVPYFAPYMLSHLELGYAEFTLLTAAAYAVRVACLPVLGRFAQRRGTRALLRFGALGVAPLPALWLVSDSVLYLLALQIFAGVFWAAFDLAALLSLFERIPTKERTSILTWYNFASAVAIVGGSLVGAHTFEWAGPAAYTALFLISTFARIAAAALIRAIPELPRSHTPLTLRTLAIRPGPGGYQRPVLASMDPSVEGEDPPKELPEA